MPSFTARNPGLTAQGPLVEVLIGQADALAQAMKASGMTLPNPVKIMAMVDTGATATVVTPRIVTQLGLSPVGSMSVNTPNAATPNACYLYDVSVGFLPNRARISSVRVIAATLSGQPIDCLIGRDILAKGILVYIGYDNQFTLSF